MSVRLPYKLIMLKNAIKNGCKINFLVFKQMI